METPRRGQLEEKADLRWVRNRAAIKESFLSLLREKPYRKITVQDIATRARINRNTLYLHYEGVEGLRDALLDEIVGNVPARSFDWGPFTEDEVRAYISGLSRCIGDHRDLCQAFFESDQGSLLQSRIEEAVARPFFDFIAEHGNEAPELFAKIALRARFVASGTAGSIREWIMFHPELDADTVADVGIGLCLSGWGELADWIR